MWHRILCLQLNFVDLAGSERVAKSHVAGRQLAEAKHINLSLHYLETVIISLQQGKGKSHIPYRNSVLTKLLKDR
jgi:kinesin family protein 6/9